MKSPHARRGHQIDAKVTELPDPATEICDSQTRSAHGGAPARLLSLDAFRGLIMCTLAINGFALAATAKKLGFGPDVETDSVAGWIWQTLAFHNSHPAWDSQFYLVGCSYWDLIQPAFLFMVGVAMPYSYASRRRRGDSVRKLALHALIRAIVLVILGVFLQTKNHGFDTNALFTNVLSQIGLGYFFVYLVMGLSVRAKIVIGATLLVGYAAWMGCYHIAQPIADNALESIQSLKTPPSVAKQYAIGINAAAQADMTLLGWVLGNESIQSHRGGYATLNFVPSSITLLLGVLAGDVLRSSIDPNAKLKRLVVGGLVCMILAVVASFTFCPVIKRIWTPAWTLYSGAYVLWTLAVLYWMVDLVGWRRWTFPLVVVGSNSLAMYLMSMLWKRWIAERLQVYFGDDIFAGNFGPMIQAVCVFAVLWLICLYLYRSKLFFRI